MLIDEILASSCDHYYQIQIFKPYMILIYTGLQILLQGWLNYQQVTLSCSLSFHVLSKQTNYPIESAAYYNSVEALDSINGSSFIQSHVFIDKQYHSHVIIFTTNKLRIDCFVL